MKTFEEIKDDYAKRLGYRDWLECYNISDCSSINRHLSICAEIYSNKSVNSALQEIAENVSKEINDYKIYNRPNSNLISKGLEVALNFILHKQAKNFSRIKEFI